MKKPTPNLTHLLNKVEAMFACEGGTEKELVAFLGVPQPRVSEWVRARKYPPGPEITLQMQSWLTLKEKEIEGAESPALVTAYAREFRRVCKDHPVEI